MVQKANLMPLRHLFSLNLRTFEILWTVGYLVSKTGYFELEY